MSRIVILVGAAALAAACGNVQSNELPGGNGDDDGIVEPDAGAGSGSNDGGGGGPIDGGGGSGSNDGGTPDAPVEEGCTGDGDCATGQHCNLDTGVCESPTLTVQLVPTTIRDERGDQITFTSGEPVHAHAGPTIALGGASCPAVYKYSYLLGPTAPLFGNETAPNPLAWKFRAAGGTVAAAEFRVRTATATELDWSPATIAGDGTFTAGVQRSGPRGVAKLEGASQQFFIDVRVRDHLEREAIATTCWEHHALAAPVSFSGLAANTDSDAMKRFTLAADSPISQLMRASTSSVKVMQGRITHQTAEPVTIHIDVPKPAVAFSKTVVTDWLGENLAGNVPCGNSCARLDSPCVPRPATDARCTMAAPPDDPADPTVTGMLGAGQWSISVVDAQTKQPVPECTATATTVQCALAGRTAGAPVKDLLIVTRAHELADLEPVPSADAHHLGLGYTGLATTQYSPEHRCTNMKDSPPNANDEVFHTCTSYTTYRKLVMLDRVRLDVTAPVMTVTTGGSAPPYLVNGKVNGTSFVWDSGDDNLPGPH